MKIVLICLLLTPVAAFAEDGGNEHHWNVRVGPRIGMTALNAEGYGRNAGFDEREWGFGFLFGGEMLIRYEADRDSFAFGISLSQLISKRSFGGFYDYGESSFDVDKSFWAYEWQASARLSFPAIAAMQPFVSAGLYAYLPQDGWTPEEDVRDVEGQLFSPQVGIGLELPVGSMLFAIEVAYQRTLLPFSYCDGYSNGSDGAILAVSALF